MFYCPKCRMRLNLEINIKEVQAEFSSNVLTNCINLSLCSLGTFENIEINSYKCPMCGKKYSQDELYTKSNISSLIDKIENFYIISIKNKNCEKIAGKEALIIPPKIIHQTELNKFKEYNPYEDDKYLIISKLNKITFITPK